VFVSPRVMSGKKRPIQVTEVCAMKETTTLMSVIDVFFFHVACFNEQAFIKKVHAFEVFRRLAF
jgi:hypothetical protein